MSSKIKATLSGNFALVLSNDIDLAAEFDPAARMDLLRTKDGRSFHTVWVVFATRLALFERRPFSPSS